MGESENLHCEHDIRNEHVRYSTNLSTKTQRGRISKNENRTNLFFEYRKTKNEYQTNFFFEYRKTKNEYQTNLFFEYRKTKNEYRTNFFF